MIAYKIYIVVKLMIEHYGSLGQAFDSYVMERGGATSYFRWKNKTHEEGFWVVQTFPYIIAINYYNQHIIR